MSSSPKRRAHVWYAINNKKEDAMQKSNDHEPLSVMNLLCAMGFLVAFVLVVLVFAVLADGLLCALGFHDEH